MEDCHSVKSFESAGNPYMGKWYKKNPKRLVRTYTWRWTGLVDVEKQSVKLRPMDKWKIR